MGCHAGRAQDDAKAVGLCAPGKRSRLGGRAVCRQDVCLKGDVQRFELGTGPLDHRPIAVGTHDHSNFTNHNPNPLFPLLTNKKGSGTPAPQPLFLRILFPCLARSCTMPLTCTNIVSFHATRQRLFWISSSAVSVLTFLQGAGPVSWGDRPCATYSLRQNNGFAKGVAANSPLCFHAPKNFQSFVQFRHRFLFKYDLWFEYIFRKIFQPSLSQKTYFSARFRR